MNILIVCHAGAGVGLGHLTRSLVAARGLQHELGANVHLLIQGNPPQRDDLERFDYSFVGFGGNLPAEIRQQAQMLDARIVIFDLLPRLLPEDIGSVLRQLRREGMKLVSIDGLVTRREELDLVFIPSPYFSSPKNAPGSAPVLSGWDCLLLNVTRGPKDWAPGRKVLALAGGSDATALGKTLPIQLDAALSSEAELHWVTGPFADAPAWPDSPRIRMFNHLSPSDLSDLMVDTNYALTVFGVSFFELLYYGVPTVVFSPYGDKDDLELARIASEGIALVAKDETEAVARLKELMVDDALAASLSQRARQKLSAPGEVKFAHAVAELFV